jgi:putative nucleotidyltransferase with HDIG domain
MKPLKKVNSFPEDIMGLRDAIKRAQEQQESGEKKNLIIPDELLNPEEKEHEKYQQLDEAAVQRILDKIDEIPTLPAMATMVLDKINDPNSDAKSIADIIKNDQSLTAKVLKMSNSVFYKGYSDITSIQTAIARLGIMTIKRMVFTVSVFDTFDKFDEFDFSLKDFWHHSIAVAVASKLIGEKIGVKDTEDLFTAGILHDIGKLIMVNHVKIMFGEVLDFLEANPQFSFFDAEKHLFRFTHCDIGSWLAIKWQMSRRIQNVIYGHHKPNLDTTIFTREILLFPAIVHIANNLVKQFNLGNSGNQIIDLDQEVVEFVLGKWTTMEEIEQRFAKEKESIEAFLGGMK